MKIQNPYYNRHIIFIKLIMNSPVPIYKFSNNVISPNQDFIKYAMSFGISFINNKELYDKIIINEEDYFLFLLRFK